MSLLSLFSFLIPGAGFLKNFLEIGMLLLKTFVDFVSWYLKEFWTGLGVIFHNLSTLTVILALVIFSGWYFKNWDNDKVLKECLSNPPKTQAQISKYHNTIKKKTIGVVPYNPPPKKTSPTFNPFNGGASGG